MRVTLFHNPGSGAEDHSRKRLLKMLRRHGYDAAYQSTKEDGWEQALDLPADLVAIAGGDGTVDKVLPRLAGSGVPAGILPVGTANNIASALGAWAETDEIIAGWSAARRRSFDVGIASGPWGTTTFIEAVGLGVFPQLTPAVKAVSKVRKKCNGKKAAKHRLKCHVDAIRSMFCDCRPVHWQLKLDGHDASGEYLVLEVMNIDAIGPGLKIARDADPSDGLLDVVLVGENQREAFQEYLDQRAGSDDASAAFPVRRAERIEFIWSGSLLHIDGDLWAGHDVVLADVQTADHAGPVTVDLQVMKHAVDVLIPEID